MPERVTTGWTPHTSAASSPLRTPAAIPRQLCALLPRSPPARRDALWVTRLLRRARRSSHGSSSARGPRSFGLRATSGRTPCRRLLDQLDEGEAQVGIVEVGE